MEKVMTSRLVAKRTDDSRFNRHHANPAFVLRLKSGVLFFPCTARGHTAQFDCGAMGVVWIKKVDVGLPKGRGVSCAPSKACVFVASV